MPTFPVVPFHPAIDGGRTVIVLESIPFIPHGAIVRGKDDKRILGDSMVVQRLKYLPDAVVNLHDKITIHADRALALERVRGHPGAVGSRQCKVYKEWFLFIGGFLNVSAGLGLQ